MYDDYEGIFIIVIEYLLCFRVLIIMDFRVLIIMDYRFLKKAIHIHIFGIAFFKKSDDIFIQGRNGEKQIYLNCFGKGPSYTSPCLTFDLARHGDFLFRVQLQLGSLEHDSFFNELHAPRK